MVKTNKFAKWSTTILFVIFSFSVTYSQPLKTATPPIPVELLFGNDRFGYQIVVKKQFKPESKFGFFGLATYASGYNNEQTDNEIVIPIQVSYTFWKGFGFMAGTSMNSKTGFYPVIGPQHNFANKKILAVTVMSYYLNQDKNLQLFGLYEFKPPINENLSVYSRFQFLYNYSLNEDAHQRSYFQFRLGLRYNSFGFGLGANLDQYGPDKSTKENYGLFLRWEFQN